eukprot:TRINITY_DN8995_c0_g1_i1.p6 TRINITY_DN8995_c0_g1~~TRINITY_DN8995_c0_g1_i1.p6  ORF type:complete len:112 (+),score=32.40 TRINITY_DN8995_c0_g1_i1:86-421(+)
MFDFFFLMIRRPPRSTQGVSSAASDVYKRQYQRRVHGEKIVPIEVKAGKNTRAKSLQEYRKKFSPEIAVRISLQAAARHDDENGTLIEMPLYLIWIWKTYLDAVQHRPSDT